VPGEQNRLLLLSSDTRPRYAEDILTALALPAGATIQFRYEDDYVAQALQISIAENKPDRPVVGTQAILGFVSNADPLKPFVVPVRFATVVEVVHLARVYTFRLRIGSYVDLGQYAGTLDDIENFSREFLRRVAATNGKYCPALTAFPDLHVRESSDAPEHWQDTARRLLLHKTFQDSYFLRIDTPVAQNGRSLQFNADGRLEVLDQQSVRILTHFYAEKYEPLVKPALACRTDGTFLRVSSDDEHEIAHRYDSIEFWLHPAALNFDTLSRVTISLDSKNTQGGLLPARAKFPVLVRRSTSKLIARVLAAAFGALLVALPAILGPSSPLQLRIFSALVGAILLAVATVFLNSASK
jgi:hypothetical protein